MYIDHVDTDNDGKEIPNSGTRFCLNAEVADRLSIPRTITLSGDASGSVNFDGSQDINLVVDIEELDNIKEAIEVLETKKPDLEEVNEQIQNLNNKFEEYLPLTAGPDKKINGPLGLTAEVMYGPELPLEENSFEGQLFFLEEDSFALPNGGRAGQVLIKNSNKNGDTIWADINAETLNGKTEEMLSVARAVEATNAINAENSNTLGGKVENELSVAKAINADNATNAANANTLEGHSVNSLLNKIYPVGSIYMSVNSVSPNVLFGGTWEALKDRFLIGAGEYTAAGSTGGEAEHTLTIAEMPSHCHTMLYSGGTASNWGYDYSNSGGTTSAQTTASGGVGLTGGSQPHNNIPPYLSVYMWKRTA